MRQLRANQQRAEPADLGRREIGGDEDGSIALRSLLHCWSSDGNVHWRVSW
jgi:hypothetical protein